MTDAPAQQFRTPVLGPDGKLDEDVIPDLSGPVAAALAEDSGPALAAAAAVSSALDAAEVPRGEVLAADEFTVRFGDGEPFVRANERDGITSPIKHATRSVPTAALALPAGATVGELPTGFAWGVVFQDAAGEQRLQLGVRDDGSMYPPVDTQYGVPAVTGPTIRWAGDSLTAGAGGNGTSAPKVLADLSGRTVLNYGGGGETSADIAGRDGANPLLAKIDGGAIPASGGVLLDIIRSDGKPDTKTLARQGSIGLNPVSLAGVVGAISYDTTASRFKFTRTAAGAAVTLLRPMPLLPVATAARRSDSLLLQLGRNNLTDADRILEDTNAIIGNALAAVVHYLVVGVLNGAGEGTGTQAHTAILALEARQRIAYGRRFVNIRRHLIDYGLAESGITPTTQDLADISADIVPTSLRSDNIHLNAVGYTVVGRFVHERAREIGMV